MRNKLLVTLAILGLLLGIATSYYLGVKHHPLPPAFLPASNPYTEGIYANGIIESPQSSGENVNMYPEVPGTVTKIHIKEGQLIKAGDLILSLDDSLQQATADQQKAQIAVCEAILKNLQDELDKLEQSFNMDNRSISKDALDNAKNAVSIAKANLDAAKKQFITAIRLLSKYQLKAIADGKILSINTAAGSYVTSQGVYDSYTGQLSPVVVMGNVSDSLAVRCYVDEILIQRLPDLSKVNAHMFIRGTKINIPLKFVRLQPNVSPKVELSNQRAERVDVRVLPVIFNFEKPKNVTIYPGQLVDVYISEK